ncbi:MAG: hypothetical protein MUE33_11505 [Cytophagaceae bacterium]|jgi:DNA polymerase-3 subunit delta'|nr:hypothetical protein [Cytophagaceae bacterium]
MLFAQIPGLTEIKQTLIQSVHNNHVAHAQLFAGTSGSAAFHLALAYATFINCEDKQTNDACGRCPSCIKYSKLIHPDLHLLFPVANTDAVKDATADALLPAFRELVQERFFFSFQDWIEKLDVENKQLTIKVEESRTIIKKISLKAYEAEYKVVLIWLQELMGTEGSNALLKSLEEPPAKTIFLLVSEQPDKLLTTILSRTQRITVRPFTDAEISSFLMDHKQVSAADATRIAYLANGNIVEALRLMSDEEQDYESKVKQWLRVCYTGNIPEMIQWSETFSASPRENQKSILQFALSIFRDSLMYKEVGTNLIRLDSTENDLISKMSAVIDFDKVAKMNTSLNDAYAQVERNINSKLVFLDTSFQLFKIFKSVT